MELEKLLNEEQYLGAITPNKYVRIIAGAGSGKTRVLTYRIAYLVEQAEIPPHQIMAVTFTNKAANEIKDRVVKQVSDPSLVRGLFLGTIHAWCTRFLKEEAPRINYPKTFTIVDEEDQLSIMKKIFADDGYPKSDPRIRQVLGYIEKQKLKGIQYKDIDLNNIPNKEMEFFIEMYGKYTDYLEAYRALDFDDLLLKSIEILKNYPQVKRRYNSFIKYILVDEFQDINDVQFELIELLMNKETSLYVVGDPDQTIYTWRGANHRLILDLEKELQTIDKETKLETIILNRNYRSSKNILSAANKLIEHNEERVKKDLITQNDEGNKISVFHARSQREESVNVVTNIQTLHSQGVKYNDIVVLYRANYLTRDLETTLSNYRIPYVVYGGTRFFQRKEIKDLISYFKLLINEKDDVAFERIINVPKRNIGPTTLDKINKNSKEEDVSEFEYVRNHMNDKDIFTSKQRASLSALYAGLDKIKHSIENQEGDYVQSLKDFILFDIKYDEYLKDFDELSYEDRKDNIDELFYNLSDQMIRDGVAFEDFVNNAVLQASQDELINEDKVSLMTVHVAKGLEYDYVFVYGLCDGIFPSFRTMTESKRGIEEERRLAYVAFTRARKGLYLSSNADYSYINQSNNSPSRFIVETGIVPPAKNYEYHDPFERLKNQPKPKQKVVEDNGIVDWKIGDELYHEKYKDGIVTKVTSTGKSQLIEVVFDDPTIGKKIMLGNHGSIRRK